MRLHRVLPLLLLALLVVGGIALAKNKPNRRPSDADRGQELYDRHCVQCHGTEGAGDGAAASALVVPVPDLRGKLSKSDRGEMAQVVLSGRGGMPGFEPSMDKYDANRVMKHMETLGQQPNAKPEHRKVPPPPPRPGDEESDEPLGDEAEVDEDAPQGG